MDYKKVIPPLHEDVNQITDHVLGADIGGTHTTVSISGLYHQKLTQILTFQFQTSQLESIIPALTEILDFAKTEYSLEISDACVAAAGIISKDSTRADLTNIPWNLSTAVIQQHTSLKNILLINDFQAIGYGVNLINHTNPHDLLNISPNHIHSQPYKPKVIIGAGTGLGKTILIYSEKHMSYQPIPSEGGHADCPMYTADEQAVYHYLMNRKQNQQPLTYEDFLSGQGLIRIYTYLRTKTKTHASTYSKHIDNALDPAAMISKYRHQDPICNQTFLFFSRIYARCAKNIALDTLPFGGLYIAGGIAQKNQDILFNQGFLDEFYHAYRRTELLKTIPLYLITDPYIGLRGACFAALQQLK